jgi:hypothetical protein
MALANKAELSQEDLLTVLAQGAMQNPMFALKGASMVNGDFPPAFPLKHQQKDMRLALELGCAIFGVLECDLLGLRASQQRRVSVSKRMDPQQRNASMLQKAWLHTMPQVHPNHPWLPGLFVGDKEQQKNSRLALPKAQQ